MKATITSIRSTKDSNIAELRAKKMRKKRSKKDYLNKKHPWAYRGRQTDFSEL